MGNPSCPKDKVLLQTKHSGRGARYKCPKCKAVWKRGQDVIVYHEPERPISEADAKLMAGKGEHKSIMSFKQRVEMFRNMRSRKRFREKLTAPIEIKPPEVKPEIKAVEAVEEPKIAVNVIQYRCKDCKETFEGLAGEDRCVACDSKNIEIVEPKTAKKDEIQKVYGR